MTFQTGCGYLAGLLLLIFIAPVPAEAADEAPAEALVAQGERLFKTKTCTACHGADAKTPILPQFPKLAGQNELYLLRQLRDIQRGRRSNGNTPPMRDVLQIFDDAELQALAAYVSTLQPWGVGGEVSSNQKVAPRPAAPGGEVGK